MQDPGDFDRGTDVASGHAGDLIRWKARQMALQLGLCQSDQNDIAQTLRLEVLRRSRAFSPGRGDWRAFIRVVIERRCRSLNRKYVRGHRHALMDGTEMGAGVSQADLFRRVHRGAAEPVLEPELRIDVREIVQRMSDQDRALCRDLSTESISETARRHGLARSTVQDHIARLRNSFKSLNPIQNSAAPRNDRGY